MFTGIIEGCGTIKKILPHGEGKRISIHSDFDLSGSKIGDSIAVNGACLTAVSLNKKLFEVDMAPETVSRTSFKHLSSGARVNIERALRLSNRIDGHLVSGHIDGTGKIASRTNRSNAVIFSIELDLLLASEMIEKGSVAVDGISLTINRRSDTDFEISVIPHTAEITTLGSKTVGDEVNIETDMIGKYVKRFLQKASLSKQEKTDKHKKDITMEILAKNGFL